MTTCFACKKPRSGPGLTAKDRYFHNACFVCCVCKGSLAGNQHYLHENCYYCVPDYQKRYGIKCKRCGIYLEGTYTTVGDSSYHNECFKCCVCCKSLAGTRHHVRDGYYYCIPDYQKKFGTKCHNCKEYLVGEYTTADGKAFHEECFKCNWCEKRFDKKAKYFRSSDGQDILCLSCHNHTKDTSNLTEDKPFSPSLPSYKTDQSTTERGTNTGKFDNGKSSKTVSEVPNFSHSPTVKTNDSWRDSLKSFNSQCSLEEKKQSKSQGESLTKMDVHSMKMLYKENPSERQSGGASTSILGERTTSKTKKPGKLDEAKFSVFENMLQQNIRGQSSSPTTKAPKRSSVLFSSPVSPTSPTTSSQPKDVDTNNVSKTATSSSSASSSTTSDCVICCDNQADHVFTPCGHLISCEECAEEYKKSRGPNLECPICRTPSTGILKIYKP